MDLGAESDFTEFPAYLELEKEPYYLVRSDKGYQLLSSICPHHGGEVLDWVLVSCAQTTVGGSSTPRGFV